MKKLLILSLLMWGVARAQTTGYLRYDTTRLEKIGGNNELILMNGTRAVTGGVLTNIGNGRTAFVTPGTFGGTGISKVLAQYGLIQINDSTFRVDTSFISGIVTAWRLRKIRDSLGVIIDGKQPVGDYITSITGDGTAIGPGAAALTLASTGVIPGSYSNTNVTVDAKGRITAISTGPGGGGGSGTVTSVATNTSTGITGGTITTTGTIAADTTVLTTRSRNQQGIDALTGLINAKLAISDTSAMLTNYVRRKELKDTAAAIRAAIGTGGGTSYTFVPPLINTTGTVTLDGAASATNRVYGQSAHGVWGMQRVFPFDSTSGPSDSGEVHFNKSSKQFYVTPISTGGGGSSASMGKMNFTIGGIGAPAAGDSVLTSAYLIGKDIDVYLGSPGGLLDSSGLTTTSSYTFDNTTGAITFKLAGGPGFVTGDHVEVRAWPTANVYTIPVPAVWSSFAYETRTGGTLTKVGNVYTASSSGNWNHTGLSSTTFTGNGRIRFIVPSLTTDLFAAVGLDPTNAEQEWDQMSAAIVMYASGSLRKMEAGVETSVGTITAGQYVCIYRNGSTFKVQKSSDGETWTDVATFTYTSSGTMYNVVSVYNNGILNNPQIKLE